MLQRSIDRARARRSDAGFTLIELLIVIVILGILAAIVVFSVSGITDRGAKSACEAEVSTVQTAEEADYAQNGHYADLAGLKSDGFLHTATPKYVASASSTTGALTMASGAPCSGS